MTPDERRDRVRAAALAGLRRHDEATLGIGGVKQAQRRERAADDITRCVLAALGDPETDDTPMLTARVEPRAGITGAEAQQVNGPALADLAASMGITVEQAAAAADRLLAAIARPEVCTVCAGRGDGCYPDPAHPGWWYCGWSGAGRPDVEGSVHARWPAECPAGPVPHAHGWRA